MIDATLVQATLDQVLEIMENRFQHRGFAESILYLKAVRLVVVRFLFKNPYFNHPLVKVDKEGFPVDFSLLKELLNLGTIESKKGVFTILNIGRAFTWHDKPDLSTITDEWKGSDTITSEELEYALRVLNVPKGKIKDFNGKFHMSVKRGPQGQALLTSLTELTLLPPELKDNIILLGGSNLGNVISRLLAKPWGLSWAHLWALIVPPKSQSLRKLSFFGDPEGKVRVIAIFDYWSQTALLPLHRGIMNILSSISTDGTKNQNFFTSKSLLPIGNNLFHSLDLTAATDRMPIALQERIVSYLYGSEVKSKAWKYIMTALAFTIQISNNDLRQVSYGAGQPMGAYSSWAVMALTHHIIVQVAAHRAGYSQFFTDYCLLGDDIRIDVDKVAEQYILLLQQLDMPISMPKTHSSSEGFEFAKRWFISGEEITGFSVSGLLSVYKSYSQLHNFFQNQISHGFKISFNGQVELISAVHKIIYEKNFIINKTNSMIKLYTVFDQLQSFIKMKDYTEVKQLEFIETLNNLFGFSFLSPTVLNTDVPNILKRIIGLAKKELIERDMKRFNEEHKTYFKNLCKALTLNPNRLDGATIKHESEGKVRITSIDSPTPGGTLQVLQRSLRPGVREMFTKMIMYSSSSLVMTNRTKVSLLGTLINDEVALTHPLLNTVNHLLNQGANTFDKLEDRLDSDISIDWLLEEGLAKYFLSKGTFSLRKSDSRILAESALTKLVIDIFKRIETNKSVSFLDP
jgi:hypothetical protein